MKCSILCTIIYSQKSDNFVFPCFHILFMLNRTQSHMSATFNFQMPIEMFDTLGDAFTFRHIWTGAKSDGVTFFTALNGGVGLVCITPWSTSVNKDFELAGNISPVGRSNRNDNVGPFVFGDYFKDIVLWIVLLKTFGGIVTTTAAFAEKNIIIVYADKFDFMPN